MHKIPQSQNKWIEYYPFLEKLDWTKVYTLPSRVLCDTYILTLQFKIVHRVFNCNYNLFKWQILDSPKCHCSEIDTLEHYFFYCPSSALFWQQFELWLFQTFKFHYKFSVLEILLGIINIEKCEFYSINYMVLICKYFIKTCKINERPIHFSNFLNILKNRLNIEMLIAKKNGKLPLFSSRFGALLHIIQQ